MRIWIVKSLCYVRVLGLFAKVNKQYIFSACFVLFVQILCSLFKDHKHKKIFVIVVSFNFRNKWAYGSDRPI